MIFSDEGNEKSIQMILRNMQVQNSIDSQSKEEYLSKVDRIIEDVNFRRSNISHFIQTVDVIAFLLFKKEFPSGSTKKYNLDKMFTLLDPILLKGDSSSDKYGIIRG